MIKKSILLIVCSALALTGTIYGAIGNYPQKIETIEIGQANYTTPENTLSAIQSCLIAEDLSWCDETMTNESLQEEINDFIKAGIDREQIFTLEKNIRDSFIVDRIIYRDTVILLVEDYSYDGSISRIPMTFVKEDGLWKQTNKFSADEELHKYLHYVPPLFHGKGQRPVDVNSFLGYEQPTQVKTELAAGAANYTVHVYYGKTVDPATFTAKLNKQDISSQFSPKPFTDQEVVIPLQQGRNVLVMSVEGTRKDGQKAKDSDRLVFIVP